MKKRFFHTSLAFISLFAFHNIAAPVDLWFEKANTFYEKDAYDSAVIYYERILEAGINNSDIYYNLGNAYFRQHKLGLAVLCYEKARKFAPADPDILANIRFTQLNIIDRIPEPQRSFFGNVLWRLHTKFPLNTQIWMFLGTLFFLSIAFTFWLFASHNLRLWLIYTASLCIIISCLLSFSIGMRIYYAEKKQFAIVLEKTVDAKNQPDGNKVLFTVHEGIKFQIRKSGDSWSLVSLPNGVSGWVENSSLGQI